MLYDGTLGKRFRTNSGIRIDHRNYGRETKLSPRFSLAYEVDSRSELRGAIGVYRQSPHFRGLWMNDSLASGQSVHYVLGYKYRFPSSVHFWSEVYWKSYKNLAIFNENLEYANSGRGHAIGAEFYLRKEAGNFRGWISYALAQSMRQGNMMDSLGFAPFDRRHSLSLVAEYRIKAKSDWVPKRIAGNFIFTSGTPFTPIVDAIQIPGSTPQGVRGAPFSARNQFRDNLTLHIGWERIFGNRKRSIFRWSIEIWNLYNQRNICGTCLCLFS